MLTESDILGAKILIVDDQAAHVLMIERLLRDAGYGNVSSTLDPQQVRALHLAERYDLILLDLQMPGLDGFGVMDALRLDADEDYLPVIALTAQPAHKLQALQAGARDFINKPFDMVEVKVRIHHMLEVRLLHKALRAHGEALECVVLERTAELRASEARFRGLTELAADWYWEQNEAGEFTSMFGPVAEMLGIHSTLPVGGVPADAEDPWEAAGRQTLMDYIAARQPFLDFAIGCRHADGSLQQFRISGQPIFDPACRFVGYRGVGVRVLAGH